MRSKVINIREDVHIKTFVKERLCFTPFINYLKNRIEVEKTIKSQFYQLVLNKFNNYPNISTSYLEPAEAVNYVELLELIYTILSPTIEDEHELVWALSTPSRSKVIFSTEAFSGLIKQQRNGKKKDQLPDAAYQQLQINFAYRLILQRLYDFPPDVRTDGVFSLPDTKTGLTRYYRVHTDIRFIDVSTDGPLPEINAEIIEPFIYEGADTALLNDIIPLDMFTFDGFSVISMEDITAEQSIENIRQVLINNTGSADNLYKDVIQSLQTLTGNPAINFGLLPLLKINDRLIFDNEECFNSLLVKTNKGLTLNDDSFSSFINAYIEQPVAMYFNSLSAKKIAEYPFLKILKEANIASYAILPVFYNKHLAGILEVFSAQRVVFYEKLLSKIQSAIPLISQLLHNTAEQLNERLEEVIKTRFTTLQPAVQWKFSEVAWHYLVDAQTTDKPEIKFVSFRNVYPLYGAIDIRNSTIYHNTALKNDVETLIVVLNDLVLKLKDTISNKRKAEALVKRKQAWIKKISEFEKAKDETSLRNFITDVIMLHLRGLAVRSPSVNKLVTDFEKAAHEKGETYKHRRDLELSIAWINKTLGTYFDKAQAKLQKIYPCYFEKFRSDGIEYDIYTGQDIAPQLPFSDKHLKSFRHWQLKSMIDLAKLTHQLEGKMPVPLQTASLIFTHSSQIDICFRNDERRFDVEGYYNIRYEVIKKRIDKVHIKHTNERLTQPGKIALVYFNNAEADEYIDLIKQLQKDKQLGKEIEFVELENLQGVTGLKALRVDINYT